MRLALSTVCFIALLVHTSWAEETPSWAWGQEKPGDKPSQDVVPTSTGFSFQDQELNETNVDGLIDSIISSTRQGRTLQGFDEVYSDPSLQEAIQKGDGQARNLIKDKLCSLGLMECDGVSARRPHHPLSPEDLIYAQPVAIKPVGHPIPSIPVRGPPRGGYGPPKPMPPPHGPSGIYGPPRPIGHGPPRRGYGPPFKPSGSYYESHGSSSSFSSKPLGPIFEPIEPEGPYQFEVPSKIHHKEKLPIEVVVNAQGGSSQTTTANGGVQQHVHHHFHHGEGANVKVPTVVVNNPVPIASQGHIHSSSSAGIIGGTIVDSGFAPINGFGGGYKDTSFSTHKDITTATFANANNGLGTYASGVKPVIENYSPQSFGSAGTLGANSFGSSGTFGTNSFGGSSTFGSNSFGNPGSLGVNSFGSSGTLGANSFGSSGTLGSNSFGTLGVNSFGASVGSYGSSSSPFYKKDLNLNRPLNGNSLQSAYGQSSYADSYRGFESVRNENYDCICVPYDQCPTQDIIGRKDDLYLPLDPRNLKSDIEAITDEVVVTDGNGTMSVVRVPKQIKLENEQKPIENSESKSAEEAKKVTKREAPLDKNDAKGKSKIEPRLLGSFGNKNTDIQPTFGVSFGLPQGSGGYPLNPFSPNPFANPYGNVIGGGGINLGLVSVNPLISVQVTKDEDGEKVVKPFVNLHVTPNDFLVQKLTSYLHHKKEALHQHVHHHSYPKPPPYYQHHHEPTYGYHPPTDHYYGPPQHHTPHNQYYDSEPSGPSYYDDSYEGNYYGGDFNHYGRSLNFTDDNDNILKRFQQKYTNQQSYANPSSYSQESGKSFSFPKNRRRRDTTESVKSDNVEKRQAYIASGFGNVNNCGPRHVCCRRPVRPQIPIPGNGHQCGTKHSQGINGRVKNPSYIDGDSEFGEYPWQVAILKKDPKESVYVCGGTLIDSYHIITAAHCVKTYSGFDLRVRLGEWDVNHDVEFFPYIERDIQSVHVHPEFYAGTLYNDLAILRMNKAVDWTRSPHISPACLPDAYTDYTGARCWTTGWGKDAFGQYGKYQNILKEVDVPIISHAQCQAQMKQTRLGYDFKLHNGFICAGGEEGKDACKGDGGGPMVCERGGSWKVVGVVSWGIGCGQPGVPGVYVKVAHYLDWIKQIVNTY